MEVVVGKEVEAGMSMLSRRGLVLESVDYLSF